MFDCLAPRPFADEMTAPPSSPDRPPNVAAARVFLRPIANPFALGFFGLGGATVAVSGLELGWIPSSQRHQVALIVLVFAAFLQAIACVFGFLSRDPVAATGMGLLSGTWAAIGLVLLTSPPGSTSRALALFLFLVTAGYAVSAATAALTKLVPALVLAGTGTRLCLTGVSQWTGGSGWRHVAGYAGVVLAALAVYAAASLELEDERRRTLLPTLRRGAGADALTSDLADQVAQIAAEAGVRKPL